MKRLAVALMTVAAVLVAAPAAQAKAKPKDPLIYVAMGDSYTSGPLVLPHDQRWVPQDCGQSRRNYPHIAAQIIKADEFKDVSCGSATIDDFSHVQHAALGQPAAPQFAALHPQVDVVTVGIGGNDVGFVGLALDCIRFPKAVAQQGSCVRPNFPNGVDKVSQDIKAMGQELGVAIEEIHRRAPHALVFIVSYPDAVPNDGKGCYPYMPIYNEDMGYVVAKFKEMNRELRTTAEAHRARYIDIYTPSIGHDACKPPGIAWVNGAVLVPPSFPAHPNDLSFLNSGPVVAKAINAALRR